MTSCDITLGDILTVKHGFAFKGEYFADTGSELVLTPGNFAMGGGLQFRVGKERYYIGPYPESFRLSPGDMLVVMTDLKQDAPILGSPAVVPEGRTLLHNQRLGLVQLSADAVIDRPYLYYLLLCDSTRQQIRATATGSTVRHTAPERIYRVRARIPSIAEQRAIGWILGAFDDLIENNRRRIVLLERMAQEIYRGWFSRPRPADFDGQSEAQALPAGWEAAPFARVARFVNGFAFKPSHWGSIGRPILKIRELKQGVTSNTPRCAAADIQPKFWVEPGDLLFSWSADLCVQRWPGEPGLLNQHLFRVLPDERLSLAYLRRALEEALPQFKARAQGTTMKHIKRSALSEVRTIVPPAASVDQFTRAVEPMDQMVAALTRQAEIVQRTRDLLLPRLVTGQIDISALDLDALGEQAS